MTESTVTPAKESGLDANEAYRVLVVDDSAVIRGLIARALDSHKFIRVVGTASNGQFAVDNLRRTPADVIILDIEMPVMDGITAIPLLKEVDPGVQIIMASTLTQKNADISLKALAVGATDYIPKPTSTAEMTGAATDSFNRDLVEKVRVLGELARKNGVRMPANQSRPRTKIVPAVEKKRYALRPMPTAKPDIIAIGSSTGGPQALFEVIKTLGGDLQQPVVITQHMPPSFTTILAEHIAKQCNVVCTEARDGEMLKPRHYYVAPGDYHMLITRKPEGAAVKITKDPQENFCRPAVDPMLRSLVEVYGRKVLAVILTGMGSDGCKGCEVVVNAGGAVVGQDEETSVVWGMPAAVANAGICSAVLPVKEIGAAVRQIASKVGL
jgi:two-component system, chemotaxis family, protein-glutamate methylesterase/glutaminase